MKNVNFDAVEKLVLGKSSKLENEDQLSQVLNRKVRGMIKRAREAYLTHDWNKLCSGTGLKGGIRVLLTADPSECIYQVLCKILKVVMCNYRMEEGHTFFALSMICNGCFIWTIR